MRLTGRQLCSPMPAAMPMRRAQRRRRASGERIPLLGLGLDGPGWPAGGGGAGQGARRIQVGALVDPDPSRSTSSPPNQSVTRANSTARRVTASSPGVPRLPGVTLVTHRAPPPTAMPRSRQGSAVACRRPCWWRDRSRPPCSRRPAPTACPRHGQAPGAGDRDDRGEQPTAVEGGHGDNGSSGRVRRLGRPQGARGVGGAGACGRSEQPLDDQQPVPAERDAAPTGDRRGLAWRSSLPRAPA